MHIVLLSNASHVIDWCITYHSVMHYILLSYVTEHCTESSAGEFATVKKIKFVYKRNLIIFNCWTMKKAKVVSKYRDIVRHFSDVISEN